MADMHADGERYLPFTEICAKEVDSSRDRYLLYAKLVKPERVFVADVNDDSDGIDEKTKEWEGVDARGATNGEEKEEGKSEDGGRRALNLLDDDAPVDKMARPMIYCKHPFFWTCEEVDEWADFVGLKFSIEDLFIQNSIDGGKLLEFDDLRKLESIGIKFDLVRKRIADKVGDLLQEFCPDGLLAFKEQREEMRIRAIEDERKERERRRLHALLVASATVIQSLVRARRARQRYDFLKESGKADRDPASMDFFEIGLALAKCTELMGAKWWRERRCARLVDVTCGSGKVLMAAMLHVPFKECMGLERDVHMLASASLLLSRFDNQFRGDLPQIDQTVSIAFRELTFREAPLKDADCVFINTSRFLRQEFDANVSAFVSKAARLREGSFVIAFSPFSSFALRVPDKLQARYGTFAKEDSKHLYMSWGETHLSIHRKVGGRPAREV